MRHFLIIILLLLASPVSVASQLPQRDYQLLMQASDLIGAEKYAEAYAHLLSVKEKVSSTYARALVSHNLGQVEVKRERYKQALGYLGEAYALNVLPRGQQTSLLKSLAQLNCIEEQWEDCIGYLKQWMLKMPDNVSGEDNLLLAQAYSQTEQWSEVISPISRAIDSREVAPESWHQLKVIAHSRQSHWRAAIREQKRLISRYADRPGHWRQLVSLHLQAKDHKAALADQRIAFERGVLRERNDYHLLAQMMLRAQIPYFAGQVLEKGLARGVLEPDAKTLRLLSRSWIQARESTKAVNALEWLNDVAPTEQSLAQLARAQIDLQKWSAAQHTLQRAIESSQGEQGQLQLLLGITRIKLKHYDKARKALVVAAKDKQLKTAAEGWVSYLDQISPPA
ncbi:hypothetical protein QKW35_09125 [Pontibacterium granulatum]|uniref:tetratricopeptide repeat protein n=1 Tax=Pontibacterium granulatum TaxID=2036029 RepID=UPI00249A4EDA|nr:hypothetical protein [Pontibacterium granulatum]MDI3324536.1 hypothetical protein [Pontibacterium granulatum]